MFGYVTTNMEEMKIKDYRIYHGFTVESARI